MLSFTQYDDLHEAAYAGNIGIMELVKFYEKATPDLVKKVKALIANKENAAAWEIIQKVTGVKLHKSAFSESASPSHLEQAQTAMLAGDYESAKKHLAQHVSGKSRVKDAYAAKLMYSLKKQTKDKL